MAHGSDIRRIGKYMRSQGADGSLVAWVEAELDRLDLTSVGPGALDGLRDDLTIDERELIVRAVLHLAVAAARVRGPALAMAASVAEALEVSTQRLDALAISACGRTMEQVQLLAALKLGTDASPAEVRRARQRHRPPAGYDVLDSLFEGEHTDPGQRSASSDGLQPLPSTPDGTESSHHTERMDHLADALRALDEQHELEPIDDLDEPTVEMSRAEANAAVHRARGPREPTPAAAPPTFSPVANSLSEGPPSLGVRDADLEQLGSSFDDSFFDDDDLEAPPWDPDGTLDETVPHAQIPPREPEPAPE